VSHLCFGANEEDIGEVFNRYGRVQAVRIRKRNGSNTGQALVEFESPASAASCLQAVKPVYVYKGPTTEPQPPSQLLEVGPGIGYIKPRRLRSEGYVRCVQPPIKLALCTRSLQLLWLSISVTGLQMQPILHCQHQVYTAEFESGLQD
jgi:RNA recognition motif-containing protein